jgi:transmembrane sensor
MDEEKLKHLLYQYFNNTITPADCIELLHHINANSERIADIINTQQLDLDEGPDFGDITAEQVFQRIMADARLNTGASLLPGEQKNFIIISLVKKQWFKAAAILLVCSSIALFKMTNTTNKAHNSLVSGKSAVMILPGSNKAILTLPNNKVIVLGSNINGLLVKSGSINVCKVHDGQLIYKDSKAHTNLITAQNEPTINTLTTPRGGQYQVVLEDGSKVWLNSASSISYPDKFTGNSRHVKLTGEAYFEVAKNKEKPFYVDINNVQVRVLGTHFNIAAYGNDDNITTTLLEGSVQVTKSNSLALIKPGEQAVCINSANNIQVSQADVEQAIAWKNGYFVFNDENINGIMKKVSRWYNVDVEYKGDLKGQRFGGIYDRSKSITELLNYLQKIGNIHFEIREGRIIVMN